MMFGRSEGAFATSPFWAASPDPEQPTTSKAAEHTRITRSILPATDSLPPLVGRAPALPASLFNPTFCIPSYQHYQRHHDQNRYPLQGSPFPGRTTGVRGAAQYAGKGRFKRGTHALSLMQPRHEAPSHLLQCATLL